MTTHVVDQSLRERLADMSHAVEFRDESGRTLGRFLPEWIYLRMIYKIAESMFNEEELARARCQPGGKPLVEILARLPG
jgi:hypothetical protein